MKHWSLEFLSEADKDLSKLNKEVRHRIIDKLDWLVENFDEIFPLALGGEFKNFFKLRVGDWRVIYKIDWENRKINICYIDHRNKIYKKKI